MSNGWRIFRPTVCCAFVEKRLTDISERKGKENSIKIKKITIRGMQAFIAEKKPYIWQQTVDLYPFADRKSVNRLLSVCCTKMFPVRVKWNSYTRECGTVPTLDTCTKCVGNPGIIHEVDCPSKWPPPIVDHPSKVTTSCQSQTNIFLLVSKPL